MEHEIIVIGAGPAGLMAAYELCKKGRKVLILEARDRIGGRIHTLGETELGAEFIHGDLPITFSLLKEAGISYTATAGSWVQLKGGEEREPFDHISWPALLKKLKALEQDMSLAEFLTEQFPEDKYAALRDQAVGYAEGYDTADVTRVSAKALYEEWSEDHDDQYRIDGGYGRLMQYLRDEILRAGGQLLCAHPVTAIIKNESGVSITAAEKRFTAAHAIVAMPLGVLQKDKSLLISSENATYYRTALSSLGFGDVIKYVFCFRKPFWESAYPDLGFLLSGAEIPTWWTQMPNKHAVLTGWLGGRGALTHSRLTEKQLFDVAVSSLAGLFSLDRQLIIDGLVEHHVANWSADQYAMGSYAYATVGFENAIQLLHQPLDGSIHFAGEYMYEGPAMGTVEAALWSGRETASQL